MKTPNLWVASGVLFLFLGAVITLAGGLLGSVTLVGTTMPSLLFFLLGIVSIRIGTRPGKFGRR